MAYNFCQHCGTKLSPDDRACPNCGAPVPRSEEINGQSGNNYQGEYRGENQQNYGQGGYAPYEGANSQGGYSQGGMYTPPQPPMKRSLDVAMLILSIANIIFGCCGIGMVLGIIALVFTVQAQNCATDYEYASKLRTARILNIVGIVLVALSFIFSYVFASWYMELISEILAAEGMV